MDLKDRLIVVTGATGALGAAVVDRLLEEGARCRLPLLEQEPPPGGPFTHPRVTVVPGVDAGDEAAVDAFYAAGPPPWASIHCAGGFAWASIEAGDLALLRRMLAINLETAFTCSRAAVRRMREAGGGRIVNVASRQALSPQLGASTTAYTASKAAVAAFTAALAEEVLADGILVHAVAPSILDTPANRRAMPDADFGRWVSPEAAAEAVCFLASPRSRALRGAVLPLFGTTP